MFFLENEIGNFLILIWDMIIDNLCIIFKVLLLTNIVTNNLIYKFFQRVVEEHNKKITHNDTMKLSEP